MPKIRLVIWDLDNTLWNGSVYYIDKEAITIKSGTKATLKELTKRGILCSICSKNYFEDAEDMLKKFKIFNYFKYPKIGWDLKSNAIKKLITLTGLKPEEILFVDDDPFQREEVKFQIPSINTIGLKDPLDLLDVDGIKPENTTEVDKNRVKILKEQRNREQAKENFKGNYRDFLRACNLKLRIRRAEKKDWSRIVQLLNRTNELNATGGKYKLEDIKNENYIIYVGELEDKFGDYGLIAVALILTKPNEWLIENITVSCRTMGRGIGSTLTIAILNYAKENTIKLVKGVITETESNWRMKPLYTKRRFREYRKEGKKTFYIFDFSSKILDYPQWLEIKRIK